MCRRQRAHGLSLIELVIFIVVLGVGFAGVLVLYNQATRSSVDPIVRKQVLAIASSLLEEIELRGFTYCDPDDANVYTATSTGVGANACASATTVEAIGPEAGETTRSQFDNVNDYNGLTMVSGIQDITGTTISGLGDYQVTNVSVTNVGATFSLPADEVLLISLTVTGPADVNVTLQGYRFRYAPNSP
jgi:MSHA pilin protein MshD